jgi:hypothetical protein
MSDFVCKPNKTEECHSICHVISKTEIYLLINGAYKITFITSSWWWWWWWLDLQYTRVNAKPCLRPDTSRADCYTRNVWNGNFTRRDTFCFFTHVLKSNELDFLEPHFQVWWLRSVIFIGVLYAASIKLRDKMDILTIWTNAPYYKPVWCLEP